MFSRTFNLLKLRSYKSPSNLRDFPNRYFNIISKFCTEISEENAKALEQPSNPTAKPRTALDSDENLDLSQYGSILLPTYNFAAYADKSPVLQEFIKLGVELYKIEKNLKVAQFLVQLNYEKQVKPYLLFLHDNGVTPDQLGKFITKNPLLFKEDLNDLDVRINYLKSKKFTDEMIASIITKYPLWLSKTVKFVDTQLGCLQQIYNLKGDHVRKVIVQSPRLIDVSKKKMRISYHLFKEEFGLNEHQLKKLVIEMPVLIRKDEYDTMKIFEYVTKHMRVSLDLLLKQPIVLTHKLYMIKERHKYLELLGRAQYNQFLPGYVSLTNLVQFTDEEFCEKIALTSILSYNEYLKTL